MWAYAYNRRAVSLPASTNCSERRREVKGGKVRTPAAKNVLCFALAACGLCSSTAERTTMTRRRRVLARHPTSNEALQQKAGGRRNRLAVEELDCRRGFREDVRMTNSISAAGT